MGDNNTDSSDAKIHIDYVILTFTAVVVDNARGNVTWRCLLRDMLSAKGNENEITHHECFPIRINKNTL